MSTIVRTKIIELLEIISRLSKFSNIHSDSTIYISLGLEKNVWSAEPQSHSLKWFLLSFARKGAFKSSSTFITFCLGNLESKADNWQQLLELVLSVKSVWSMKRSVVNWFPCSGQSWGQVSPPPQSLDTGHNVVVTRVFNLLIWNINFTLAWILRMGKLHIMEIEAPRPPKWAVLRYYFLTKNENWKKCQNLSKHIK